MLSRNAKKADETEQSIASLIADALYFINILRVVIFVVGAILKQKIRKWIASFQFLLKVF